MLSRCVSANLVGSAKIEQWSGMIVTRAEEQNIVIMVIFRLKLRERPSVQDRYSRYARDKIHWKGIVMFEG